MKNVKRILTLLVVLAMVFACVFALAACNDPENPGPGPSGGDGDIPTPPDGKVTLYFEIKNEVELPSIQSYFFIGEATGWTANSQEGELTRVGTTDNYYLFLDTDKATGGFKIVIGYNSTSPVDASVQGASWANEGWGPWPAASSNSFIPEIPAGSNTVKCIFNDMNGEREESQTFNFTGCLGDPVPVQNFDVRVSFVKGQLGDNAVVYIVGAFHGWNVTVDGPAKATKSADLTELDTYTIHVDSMFANPNADYLVIVFPNGLGESLDTVDEDGNTVKADLWAYANDKDRGAIKVCDNGQNAKIAVTDMYNGGAVALDVANTIARTSSTRDARGIDLNKKVANTEEGSPAYTLDIVTVLPSVEVTFSVTFDVAIPENLTVYLAGTMENWTGTAMTASADRKTFTYTATVPQGSHEFKVVVMAGAFSWNDESRIEYGNPKSEGTGMDNRTITVSAEGTVELFDGVQTYKAAAAD